MTLQQVPASAFGGGIIGLPTEGTTLSLLALGSEGIPADNNVGNAFKNGTMVVVSAQVRIKQLSGGEGGIRTHGDANRNQ
jgi:porin